jgi:uridine kinase
MYLIAITGGTGCGKSTIVKKIIKGFYNDTISYLSQDSYYKDNSNLSFKQRDQLNYDNPDALDFDLFYSHLKDLKNGKSIDRPNYSFEDHLRKDDTTLIKAQKILIIEGILILSDKRISDIVNLSIYIEVKKEIREERRILRDIKQRARKKKDIIKLFKEVLHPMHEKYVSCVKTECDFILDNNNPDSNCDKFIIDLIKKNI